LAPYHFTPAKGAGKGRILEVRESHIRDGNGAIAGLRTFLFDVTEKEQAGEGRRGLESLRRRTQEMAGLAGWECNLRTGRQTWLEESYRLTGVRASEKLDLRRFLDLVHRDDREMLCGVMRNALQTREGFECEFRICRVGGEIRHCRAQGRIFCGDLGSPETLLCCVQDITSEKDPSARLELAMAFLEAEREILRMLAAGEPLETMLTAIADKIDSLLEGSFCAIELLDRERSRFFWSVGPALPRSFFQEMAQLAVGPQSGTAAAAAFLNRNVIAADIATDPVWDSSRHTPLRFGMRASWSIPIRDRKSRVVVGALTVYHQTARRPEAEEIRAVEAAADLAGIAVDRKRQESDLWDSKHRFDVLTHHPPCQH
jgi:hypothetical protein